MATKRTGRPVGRPSKDTPEVRAKIEEAAALDASVEEIAFWADISRETYYEILKKDPVFADRIAKLREKPILAARQRVVKGALESYANAMDYLSRKRKQEFSQRFENTGADGKDLLADNFTSEEKIALLSLLNDKGGAN